MKRNKIISKYSQLLYKLGLSEKEAKIYLWLLSSGPKSISQISKETNLPRTTVHENVEKLEIIGLTSRSISGARKEVIAESPSKIELIIAQQKFKLKIKQENIQKVEEEIPHYLKSINQSVNNINLNINFDVKVHKGKQKIKKAYDEIFSCNEMMSFVSTNGIDALFPENYDKFKIAHNKNKQMKVWEILLYNEDNFINSYDKKRYFYKIAPDNLKTSIPVDFIIFDTKVAVINLTEDPTCIIIDNEAFYQSFKSLFKFIWSIIPSNE